MKLSEQLIGKQVSFNFHHDAFPSNCFRGQIISVENASYSMPEVKYTVKTETGTETFTACKVIVTALVESGEHESGAQWSKSTTYIKVT